MGRLKGKRECLTPTYAGGADPRGGPEVRAPALRGVLRFWPRALPGTGLDRSGPRTAPGRPPRHWRRRGTRCGPLPPPLPLAPLRPVAEGGEGLGAGPPARDLARPTLPNRFVALLPAKGGGGRPEGAVLGEGEHLAQGVHRPPPRRPGRSMPSACPRCTGRARRTPGGGLRPPAPGPGPGGGGAGDRQPGGLPRAGVRRMPWGAWGRPPFPPNRPTAQGTAPSTPVLTGPRPVC